jgi:hypothetical protein
MDLFEASKAFGVPISALNDCIKKNGAGAEKLYVVFIPNGYLYLILA